MLKRSDFLARALVILLFTYALSIGATWNGILSPEYIPLTLGMLTASVGLWLFVRWRRGWRWYATPLDRVFLLWALAFGLSLIANMDAARRIAIGLWYVGLYIGIWYVLQDLLANGSLRRETLVEGVLISGLIILIFGYMQLQGWFNQVLSVGLIAPPRPVSTFGNPNFLGAFLIVLIPLALSQAVLARNRIARIVMSCYALLSLLLLLLTFSRGAWTGMAVGGVLWVVLLLSAHGMLSLSRLKVWWQARPRVVQIGMSIAAVVALIGIVGVGAVFVRSLSQSGRSTDLRGEIYTAAVELFAEKPLTGQGLFTFGRGLVRLPDVRPDKPHSHAHDAPLHIAAELGLVGLAALATTLAIMFLAMRSNWRAMTLRERTLLAGAIGGVTAFAVHHLTDMPAMMPAIALSGLIILALALAPAKPQSVTAIWRRKGFPVGITVLWAGLLLTGWWSSRVYTQYVVALEDASPPSLDYNGAAQRLQPVIDADPNLSLYHLQQGFLYGMAASTGDTQAIQQAIAAYEQFIALDPGYALAWANLAGLKWQLGDQAAALADMQTAANLNQQEWRFRLNIAQYAAAMGDTDTANAAYDSILRDYPDASLYPELGDLAARRQLSSITLDLSPYAQTSLLLVSGEIDAAQQVWDAANLPESVANDVIQSLLALAQNDAESAANWLSRAEALAASPEEMAWTYLGRARLAAFGGNTSDAATYRDAAYKFLERQPLDGDDEAGLNIAYAQFLRWTIDRQYLPQVNYPVGDPVLLYLLAQN